MVPEPPSRVNPEKRFPGIAGILLPFFKLDGCTGFTLQYASEENFKIGSQATDTMLADYRHWLPGGIIQDFSIFLNFENFTDTRQTRFDSIYTGSISNPKFRDIYAPVDGFVVNGGMKISL